MPNWFNRRPPELERARQAQVNDGLPVQLGLDGQPARLVASHSMRKRSDPGLEPVDLEADFPGGIRVQLRFEQGARWSMWVSDGGAWKRRKDFASPHEEHACRT